MRFAEHRFGGAFSSVRPGSTRAARDQVSGTFMPQKVRIALDAMGGDVGASVVIPGAAIALKRHPDTEFLLYGDSAQIEAQLAEISGAESGLARGPYRRHRQHARQAEPGAAPRPQEFVDVACDRRREEGRGRRRGFRRQYRRADGDGALSSAHDARDRSPGHCRRLADGARRFRRARSRRQHRRRCASSGVARGHGQRDGERAVRPASVRPSACSISGSRRSRAARRFARRRNSCGR